MSENIALVFDTNFIIQNQKLDKVLSKLQEGYAVYVTQVSVEERIAQQCREIKYKIDSISKLQNDYRGLATIKLTTTYDKRAAEIRRFVQAAYDKTFGECIIPLDKDEKTTDNARKFVNLIRQENSHVVCIITGHEHLLWSGEFAPGRMQYVSAPCFRQFVREI